MRWAPWQFSLALLATVVTGLCLGLGLATRSIYWFDGFSAGELFATVVASAALFFALVALAISLRNRR